MSGENVEVVRAIYAAFARREETELLSYVHPEVTVYDRPHHPVASVYEGTGRLPALRANRLGCL